jgi:hypothetical protein
LEKVAVTGPDFRRPENGSTSDSLFQPNSPRKEISSQVCRSSALVLCFDAPLIALPGAQINQIDTLTG